MADAVDLNFLEQAIDISRAASPSSTCFSVGALLVGPDCSYLYSGFTQELGEGWHAEAVAVKKAIDAGFDPKGATIYSSMEPCSTRASGRSDCSGLLIQKGITRVIFALSEPSTFVIGKGKDKLIDAGVAVEQIDGFETIIMAINRHLFTSKNHAGQSSKDQ